MKNPWHAGLVYRFWLLVALVCFVVAAESMTINDVLVNKFKTVNWLMFAISLCIFCVAVFYAHRGYRLEKVVGGILSKAGFSQPLLVSGVTVGFDGRFYAIEVEGDLFQGVSGRRYVVDEHVLNSETGYTTKLAAADLYPMVDPESIKFFVYRFKKSDMDFLVVWDKSRTAKGGAFQVFGH